MTVAADDMVVDHARSLHEGVEDGRADELEAGFLQRLGHGVALGRLGRHVLETLGPVLLRLAADEAPQKLCEPDLVLDQAPQRFGRVFFGLPPTKLHKNFANEPSCSTSARKALALLTLASILPLWRMMPGSASSFFNLAGV